MSISNLVNLTAAAALSGFVTAASANETVQVGDYIFQTDTLGYEHTQDLCEAARANFEGAGSLARSAKILLEKLETDEDVSIKEFREKSGQYKEMIGDAIPFQEDQLKAMGILGARAAETANSGQGHDAPGTCNTSGMVPEAFPKGM